MKNMLVTFALALLSIFFEANAIGACRVGAATVTVERGDTLQKISFRLYGTTRRWYKIYLQNKSKISNINRIEVGLSLSVEHSTSMQLTTAPNKTDEFVSCNTSNIEHTPSPQIAKAPITPVVISAKQNSVDVVALSKEPALYDAVAFANIAGPYRTMELP